MSSVDNEQFNNIVQDAINETSNAHQKYIDALERRLKDKDVEIEQLQTLVNEMSNYFPACIDCEGKTTLGERTDKCVYEMDNTNYCTKRGITNIASIRNENKELKAEIERLKKVSDIRLECLGRSRAKAKVEAYKEFVEKMVEERLAVVCLEGVTEEYSNGYHDALCYVEEQIYNLKKELVGDK